MKTIKLLLAVFTVSLSVSCEKAEESIVNCLFEQALLDVHHSVSDENPLQVDLNVTYYGSETFDGYVIWDFGDGTPAQVCWARTPRFRRNLYGQGNVKDQQWLMHVFSYRNRSFEIGLKF